MFEGWELEAKENDGARIVYTFGNKLVNSVKVQISVSRIFASPEEVAWKMLSETVK